MDFALNHTIRIWEDPAADQLGATVSEFLTILGQPTCLLIPGHDRSRSRFAVTLLHGNEPSGAIALHRWLSGERQIPAVDMYCVVMNVEAAGTLPQFSLRQLPQSRDWNRCFKAPYADTPGQWAKSLLELIHRVKPEALVDIHNTSGMGPAFGVAVFYDQKHDDLVSLFTERLVVTDLRLGALMELSEADVPTVTIECGGSQDPNAHLVAYDGLQRYVDAPQLFNEHPTDWPLELLHHPVRFELDSEISIGYAEQALPDTDLTLRLDIEHFNFGEVHADTSLGWISESGWQGIRVVNSQGENLRDSFLRYAQGQLFPATNLKLFMITSNPTIAKSDCLCYAVKVGAVIAKPVMPGPKPVPA
jgi:hypothetical protein